MATEATIRFSVPKPVEGAGERIGRLRCAAEDNWMGKFVLYWPPDKREWFVAVVASVDDATFKNEAHTIRLNLYPVGKFGGGLGAMASSVPNGNCPGSWKPGPADNEIKSLKNEVELLKLELSATLNRKVGK